MNEHDFSPHLFSSRIECITYRWIINIYMNMCINKKYLFFHDRQSVQCQSIHILYTYIDSMYNMPGLYDVCS